MHINRSNVVTASHSVEMPGKDYLAPEPISLRVFDDLLERFGLTRPWVAVAAGGVLYLLYLLSISVDGFQQRFGSIEFWKSSIEPVAILTYVLLVHYFLDIYGRRAVQSVRPVIDVDDKSFDELVASRSAAILKYQWVPMVVFAGLSSLLVGIGDWSYGFYWTTLVSKIISLIEYALVGSAGYLMVSRNRFFTDLFKQPLKIDIFNLSPVKPMGRWGLSVSAALMGGVTISMLLVGDPQNLLSIEHLPMYMAATATAILMFFGSLASAHQVLVHAKQRELSAIRRNLSAMYQELKQCSATGRLQGIDQLAGSITAWLGYERRVGEVQEWPYTANTLSGLFATVLLPLIVTAIQQILIRL